MICMLPLVHWKVGVYIGCLVLLDTNDCHSNGYSLYYAHDWFVSTCLWARFFVTNRNRNVPQSNQLRSLLYRLCSVITRNIEINKRGKSTKNVTTSFFKNITAVGPLYSASHYVESELEDFPPTVSYLWTVEAYLGPLATASHSEAESVAICSTVTTSYSLDSELDDFCLLLSILWTLWITSKTFVYCFPFREQWKHLHIL